MKKRYVFALLALVCVACTKELEFVGEYDGEKLVMYALAQPGEPLSVNVAKSEFILKLHKSGEVPRAVYDVKVEGSAHGKPIVFTAEDSTGYYYSDFIPAQGDTIYLNASKEGFNPVSSMIVVPKEAKFGIESYEFIADTSGGEYYKMWNVKLRIWIDDPAGEENFYRIRMVREYLGEGMLSDLFLVSKDVIFMNTDSDGGLELIEDAINGDTERMVPELMDERLIEGKKYTFEANFNITHSKWDMQTPEILPLSPDEMSLEIDALSSDLFKYLRSVEDYFVSSRGIGAVFGEAVSIHNNIEGGIGCAGALTPKRIPLT